jgi:Tfp pilus assembly protein PilN
MTKVFYFKINLNKYGEMKLQAERENKTFRNAIIAFGVGAIIMFAGLIYINQNLKEKVDNRRKFLANTENQLKSYQTSEDYLSIDDLDRLAKTFNNRIFWAKKLVALSQEIDQKLAVRKFTFNNGVLTLNGITPVDDNVRELDLINEFILRLKSNPEISNDFPQIKSGAITKQVVKDTAILEFVIECYSNEANQSRQGAQQ